MNRQREEGRNKDRDRQAEKCMARKGWRKEIDK